MKFGMSIIVRGDAAGRETFDVMAEKAEAVALDTLDRFANEVRAKL